METSRARLCRIATAVVAGTLTLLTALQTGFWKDSLALFERAIDITPDNPFAWRNAGNALVQKGDFHRAILYFERGLKYRPADAFGWTHLGNAYLKTQQFEKALHAYQNAAGIDRTFAAPCYDAGIALRRLGRNEEAAGFQGEALRRQPAFVRAYRELAWLAAMKGDRALSQESLRRGLAACSGDARLRAEQERLSDPNQPALPPGAENLDTGVSSDTEVSKIQ
jgi:tetratricopeptide (TPR) repeat protein